MPKFISNSSKEAGFQKLGSSSGSSFGGSRTDTLIKLVLIFFISLLSFSVGTFVGKNFSDSKYKQAQLEGEFEGGRETASIPQDHLEVKPDQTLTEKDVEAFANEFSKPEEIKEANERDVASANGTLAAADSASHSDAKPGDTMAEPIGGHSEAPVKPDLKKELESKVAEKASGLDKVAQNVAAGQAPGEAKKVVNDPRPRALPTDVAASSVGKFTVQISSSLKREEAEAEAEKLISKGFSAFVVPAEVNGKTWFRVSVGLFETRQEAQTYRSQLMKESGVTTAIVQPISRAPASN